MTQNTEKNGQTQLVQISEYSVAPHTICFTKDGFEHQIAEAEARGAVEARQTDAATVEIVRQYRKSGGFWQDCTSDDVWTRIGPETKRILYTCPVEIGAMALERDRLRKYFDEVEKLLSETRKIHSRFMRIRASLTPPRDSWREA